MRGAEWAADFQENGGRQFLEPGEVLSGHPILQKALTWYVHAEESYVPV